MQVWLLPLLYLGTLWLHLTVASLFPAGSAAPDILLVAALAAGLIRGPLGGALAGLFFGLGGDLITGRLIGLGAISLAMAGATAGIISRRVFRENLLVLSLVALLLSNFQTFAYGLGARAFGVPFGLARALLAVGLPVGAYSAVLVPVVYALTYRRLGTGDRPDD